jgi:hypothetical protein
MIGDLKQEFIKQLNFDTFEVVNQEIITFFESIPHYDQMIVLKVAKLVMKYADLVDKKKNLSK